MQIPACTEKATDTLLAASRAGAVFVLMIDVQPGGWNFVARCATATLYVAEVIKFIQ